MFEKKKVVAAVYQEAKGLRCKVVAVVKDRPFYFPTLKDAKSFVMDMGRALPEMKVELFRVK